MITDFLYNSAYLAILKTSITLGIAVGIFGVLILIKKDSLLLSALSTSTFLSATLVYLMVGTLTIYPYLISSALSGVFAILLLFLIQQSSNISRGIAKSILTSIFFGVSLALLTYIDRNIKGVSLNFSQYLLGDTLIITSQMYNAIFYISSAIIIITVICKKQLQQLLFNKSFISSKSVKESFLSIMFYFMLTFLILLSNQIVGVVLSPALFLIPALTSKMIAKSFGPLIVVSAFLSMISLFFGSVIAQNVSFVPSGVIIIFVAGMISIIVFIITPREKGLLTRYFHNRKLIKSRGKI